VWRVGRKERMSEWGRDRGGGRGRLTAGQDNHQRWMDAVMARKQKEPTIGHNGGPLDADRRRQLIGYISEIERWEEAKAAIAQDITEMYAAAKGAGFDTKAMRAIIRERRQDVVELEAFEQAMSAYRHALGMLFDTPLGQAAI